MADRGHLRTVLARPAMRRLLAARLLGQFGDGMLQAALAAAVLFNPERQAHAADVAAGFTVLLLPYSVVGPFAGVLLDRWRRRDILTAGNVLRAVAVLGLAAGIAAGLHGVPFYACGLVLISAARFLLAALGASLPHVAGAGELVTANAFSTTAGTVTTAIGGATAVGIHAALAGGDRGYALLAGLSALPYVLAAAAAQGFGRASLGPSRTERARRETVTDVLRGLRAGAAHLANRPRAAIALGTVTLQRLLYGVNTVCVVLLYRNYYRPDGFFRAGLTGLSQAVVALALGGAFAALVTPAAFRRAGPVRWPAAVLCVAALAQAGLVLPYRLPLTLAAVAALAVAAQAVKISVDTVVQQEIADDFRGRVFAAYDSGFNAMLVVAAVLTATVLPDDGHSPAAVVVLSAGYLALAAGYVAAARTVGRGRRVAVRA